MTSWKGPRSNTAMLYLLDGGNIPHLFDPNLITANLPRGLGREREAGWRPDSPHKRFPEYCKIKSAYYPLGGSRADIVRFPGKDTISGKNRAGLGGRISTYCK